MHPKHWIAPLVGLTLTLGAPTIAAATPARGHSGPLPSVATITLITGDRVRVTSRPNAPEQVAFLPGTGSSSDAAVTTYTNGHTYVVPTAASADVTAGRLDRTLFDVTTLIAEGDVDSTPVIIRYAGAAKTALARAKSAVPGGTTGRVLTSINSRATRVDQAAAFWRSLAPAKTARVATTIARVDLDRRMTASLDQSVPQIGAPAAWARGFTGKGVKIAVLDTGIDPTHPDVAGRIAAAEDFTGSGDPVDHFGHGTHVASIAAGNGAASGGKYKGVAPDATLLNGKVLDDNGNGSSSGIIAGMEWATAQGAKVVNMSFGSGPGDGTDVVSQAVNRLSSETGTLFVVAAGNCYTGEPFSVSEPAAADDALAVGNMQRDGSMNDTSCMGPRKNDGALKPEISAPGTDIVAARAAGTNLGEPVDDHYTKLSGTSMASPHVAGTAALLAQAHPDWKGDALKTRLITTADPQPGSRVDVQGAGRVDADQATAGDITVDTGKLDLGRLKFPYPTTDVLTRELTYHNAGSTPVTLKLATTFEPTTAAPRLSTDQLVVPANGDAKVTVTADRARAGTGAFSGRITATADGADPLVTMIGWYAEPELYDLTVKGLMHDGSPAYGDLMLHRLDGPQPDLGETGTVPIEAGTAAVRIAPGRYEASAVLSTAATDTMPSRFDFVVSPETVVTKDTTITLDARATKVVDVGVQGRRDLTPREAGISYARTAGGAQWTVGVSATGSKRVFATNQNPQPATGTAELSTGARLEVPPYRASIVGGPAFTLLDFYLGPRFTGRKDLQVFDGGDGSPAELAGARGKLALIRNGDSSPYNGVLAKNAEDAGAAAVIMYNPDVPGDGAVFPYWALGDNGEAKIPTARTSRLSAQQLLDRMHSGPVTVRLIGQAATPYVYDLAVPWANQLPANPVVKVKPAQLSTVKETFGAHVAGVPFSEARIGTTPAGSQFGGWLPPVIPGPSTRTSYVLANQVKWAGSFVYDNGNTNVDLATPARAYRPGERSTERWMTPMANAGLPDGETSGLAFVGRSEGLLGIVLSPFTHGPEQFLPAYGGIGSNELVVTRNGTEIVNTPDAAAFVDTPADAADYRIDLKTSFDIDAFKYSKQLASTWTFRSKGGDAERMPMVLADLDVPQADGLNQVQTGRPISIDIGLRHQFGSGSTAKFAKPSVEISYDGTHWTSLPVTAGAPGKYTAKVTHPASAAGTAPSLRLHAVDAEGNSLTQQITAAYGLK
jgi:subtilisin family serine protease